MRHEDAGLALWIADDGTARDRDLDCRRLWLASSERRSFRQRAGAAFIALGERLAGEARPVQPRRLARQAS